MSTSTEAAPARDAWLLGLLAAGLLLRLGLIAAGVGQPAARWEYDGLVENLLAGRGFVYEHIAGVPYRAYYSGLPYVASLLACRWFTPSDLPVQLLQAALALLSACCAHDLARSLAGRRAGLAAAGLCLLHPGLLYYDVAQIHPLGLDAALGLASLAALRRALLSTAAAPSWLAGAVLGLAVLQRPTLLPFALCAPMVLWRQGRSRSAWIVYAAWLAVLTPWLVRNAVVLGQPVFSTTTAEHFWIGNAPGSTGGSLIKPLHRSESGSAASLIEQGGAAPHPPGPPPPLHRSESGSAASLAPDGVAVLAGLPEAVTAELARADELGQARIFGRLGSTLVKSDPLGFARGVVVKLARFWTIAPHTGLLYPELWTWVHLACYVPLLVLAALGAWRQRAWPLVGWMLGVCLSVSLAHALFYFEMRHRLALEPLLLVLACSGFRRFDLARRGCK